MSEQEGSNPYEAPAAELTTAATGSRGGSIEATLDGRSELNFSDVLSEAWQRTKGVKTIIVGSLLLWTVALSVLMGVVYGGGLVNPESPAASFVSQILFGAIGYPIFAGIILVGLRRSVDVPVEFSQVFMYFGSFLTLLAIGLLISLLTMVGYLLLILPGIYLTAATMLAMPLHVEKGLGVIDSITTSIKLVNKQFVTFLLLGIVSMIGVFVGMITVIGWIWTVPWSIMILAIAYRQLAGVENV